MKQKWISTSIFILFIISTHISNFSKTKNIHSLDIIKEKDDQQKNIFEIRNYGHSLTRYISSYIFSYINIIEDVQYYYQLDITVKSEKTIERHVFKKKELTLKYDHCHRVIFRGIKEYKTNFIIISYDQKFAYFYMTFFDFTDGSTFIKIKQKKDFLSEFVSEIINDMTEELETIKQILFKLEVIIEYYDKMDHTKIFLIVSYPFFNKIVYFKIDLDQGEILDSEQMEFKNFQKNKPLFIKFIGVDIFTVSQLKKGYFFPRNVIFQESGWKNIELANYLIQHDNNLNQIHEVSSNKYALFDQKIMLFFQIDFNEAGISRNVYHKAYLMPYDCENDFFSILTNEYFGCIKRWNDFLSLIIIPFDRLKSIYRTSAKITKKKNIFLRFQYREDIFKRYLIVLIDDQLYTFFYDKLVNLEEEAITHSTMYLTKKMVFLRSNQEILAPIPLDIKLFAENNQKIEFPIARNVKYLEFSNFKQILEITSQKFTGKINTFTEESFILNGQLNPNSLIFGSIIAAKGKEKLIKLIVSDDSINNYFTGTTEMDVFVKEKGVLIKGMILKYFYIQSRVYLEYNSLIGYFDFNKCDTFFEIKKHKQNYIAFQPLAICSINHFLLYIFLNKVEIYMGEELLQLSGYQTASEHTLPNRFTAYDENYPNYFFFIIEQSTLHYVEIFYSKFVHIDALSVPVFEIKQNLVAFFNIKQFLFFFMNIGNVLVISVKKFLPFQELRNIFYKNFNEEIFDAKQFHMLSQKDSSLIVFSTIRKKVKILYSIRITKTENIKISVLMNTKEDLINKMNAPIFAKIRKTTGKTFLDYLLCFDTSANNALFNVNSFDTIEDQQSIEPLEKKSLPQVKHQGIKGTLLNVFVLPFVNFDRELFKTEFIQTKIQFKILNEHGSPFPTKIEINIIDICGIDPNLPTLRRKNPNVKVELKTLIDENRFFFAPEEFLVGFAKNYHFQLENEIEASLNLFYQSQICKMMLKVDLNNFLPENSHFEMLNSERNKIFFILKFNTEKQHDDESIDWKFRLLFDISHSFSSIQTIKLDYIILKSWYIKKAIFLQLNSNNQFQVLINKLVFKVDFTRKISFEKSKIVPQLNSGILSIEVSSNDQSGSDFDCFLFEFDGSKFILINRKNYKLTHRLFSIVNFKHLTFFVLLSSNLNLTIMKIKKNQQNTPLKALKVPILKYLSNFQFTSKYLNNPLSLSINCNRLEKDMGKTPYSDDDVEFFGCVIYKKEEHGLFFIFEVKRNRVELYNLSLLKNFDIGQQISYQKAVLDKDLIAFSSISEGYLTISLYRAQIYTPKKKTNKDSIDMCFNEKNNNFENQIWQIKIKVDSKKLDYFTIDDFHCSFVVDNVFYQYRIDYLIEMKVLKKNLESKNLVLMSQSSNEVYPSKDKKLVLKLNLKQKVLKEVNNFNEVNKSVKKKNNLEKKENFDKTKKLKKKNVSLSDISKPVYSQKSKQFIGKDVNVAKKKDLKKGSRSKSDIIIQSKSELGVKTKKMPINNGFYVKTTQPTNIVECQNLIPIEKDAFIKNGGDINLFQIHFLTKFSLCQSFVSSKNDLITFARLDFTEEMNQSVGFFEFIDSIISYLIRIKKF